MYKHQQLNLVLGQIYITPGADDVLRVSRQSEDEFLSRHMAGDWGELCEQDRITNGDGSGYCMSVHSTKTGKKIWIITEHDHSVTTVMLPNEY